MDFVTFLTENINQHENGQRLTPHQTADLITSAAVQTVEHAAAGNTVKDTLNIEQLGTLLVALQWNVNPNIRQAVK